MIRTSPGLCRVCQTRCEYDISGWHGQWHRMLLTCRAPTKVSTMHRPFPVVLWMTLTTFSRARSSSPSYKPAGTSSSLTLWRVAVAWTEKFLSYFRECTKAAEWSVICCIDWVSSGDARSKWRDAGVVICLELICTWSSWCHCHDIISCFIKIQNMFSSGASLHQTVLEKRPLNKCLYVIVTCYVSANRSMYSSLLTLITGVVQQ